MYMSFFNKSCEIESDNLLKGRNLLKASNTRAKSWPKLVIGLFTVNNTIRFCICRKNHRASETNQRLKLEIKKRSLANYFLID